MGKGCGGSPPLKVDGESWEAVSPNVEEVTEISTAPITSIDGSESVEASAGCSSLDDEDHQQAQQEALPSVEKTTATDDVSVRETPTDESRYTLPKSMRDAASLGSVTAVRTKEGVLCVVQSVRMEANKMASVVTSWAAPKVLSVMESSSWLVRCAQDAIDLNMRTRPLGTHHRARRLLFGSVLVTVLYVLLFGPLIHHLLLNKQTRSTWSTQIMESPASSSSSSCAAVVESEALQNLRAALVDFDRTHGITTNSVEALVANHRVGPEGSLTAVLFQLQEEFDYAVGTEATRHAKRTAALVEAAEHASSPETAAEEPISWYPGTWAGWPSSSPAPAPSASLADLRLTYEELRSSEEALVAKDFEALGRLKNAINIAERDTAQMEIQRGAHHAAQLKQEKGASEKRMAHLKSRLGTNVARATARVQTERDELEGLINEQQALDHTRLEAEAELKNSAEKEDWGRCAELQRFINTLPSTAKEDRVRGWGKAATAAAAAAAVSAAEESFQHAASKQLQQARQQQRRKQEKHPLKVAAEKQTVKKSVAENSDLSNQEEGRAAQETVASSTPQENQQQDPQQEPQQQPETFSLPFLLDAFLSQEPLKGFGRVSQFLQTALDLQQSNETPFSFPSGLEELIGPVVSKVLAPSFDVDDLFSDLQKIFQTQPPSPTTSAANRVNDDPEGGDQNEMTSANREAIKEPTETKTASDDNTSPKTKKTAFKGQDKDDEAERLAQEIVVDVLATLPPREWGEREEWAKHVGWRRKEDSRRRAPVETSVKEENTKAGKKERLLRRRKEADQDWKQNPCTQGEERTGRDKLRHRTNEHECTNEKETVDDSEQNHHKDRKKHPNREHGNMRHGIKTFPPGMVF